jgi:hypothetical protein
MIVRKQMLFNESQKFFYGFELPKKLQIIKMSKYRVNSSWNTREPKFLPKPEIG